MSAPLSVLVGFGFSNLGMVALIALAVWLHRLRLRGPFLLALVVIFCGAVSILVRAVFVL